MPEDPHNRDSLAYQYYFYGRNGRWPSWADAMAHCSEDVKTEWTVELERLGVAVNA